MSDLAIGHSVFPTLTPRVLNPADLKKAALDPAARKKAEKMARDFESVFLHKVVEEMHRTVGDSGLLSDGVSKQITGLFWFYMTQELANQGGVGLWKDIYRQTVGQEPGPPKGPTVEVDR